MCFTPDIIRELELKHKFTYLSQLSFETREEKQLIQNLGLSSWKKNQVGVEEKKRGDLFIESIKKSFMPKVSVQWIDFQVGYGVFAEEDLEVGSYVGEYVGVILKNDLRRCFQPLSEYLAMYPLADERGHKFHLDAFQGNLTRFINHSFFSNIEPMQAFYDGFYHRIFIISQITNSRIYKRAKL